MKMHEVVEDAAGAPPNLLDQAVELLIDQKIPAFGIRSFHMPNESIGYDEFGEVSNRRLQQLGESVRRVCEAPDTEFDIPEPEELYYKNREPEGATDWHIDALNEREERRKDRKSHIEIRLHTTRLPMVFRAVNADRTRFDDGDYKTFRLGQPTREQLARGYEQRPYRLSLFNGVGIPQLLSEHQVVTFDQLPGYSTVFRRKVSNGYATAHEVIREGQGSYVIDDITISRQLFSSNL